MWPLLVDSSEEECLKMLRRLELEAYGSLVTALRAQGGLTPDKLKILKDTATALHIPPERHRAEIRRAVNDEQLCTIAQFAEGPDTFAEWSVEGRRKVKLMPRVAPQTAFLAVARRVADVAQADNAKLPWPAATARPPIPKPPPLPPTQIKYEQHEERSLPSKKRRRLSQETIPVPSYVPTMTKHRLQKHGISKIQQMYKSQSRVANIRQAQHQETSIMPPPRTTIKTLAPVKQRIDASPTKMQHVVPSTSTDIPMDIITSPQKQHPMTVAKVIQSSSSTVPKNLIKISQNQTQSHQKLVIVSASQTITTNMSTNKLINTLKLKPEELQVTDSGKSPKLLASQVIVSKSQLMPIQSLNEKQKVVTVQAKVRPQGSIIVPLQGQNTSATSQFAGVSVPVLQGVQWKAIQGKSTVKLLPLSGNAKIIQNKGVGSGPIYVMSKQSNMVVNKTTTPMETTIDTKSVSNVTHIRPISQKSAEEVATTTSGKVFVVRKASPVTAAVVSTVNQLAIPTTVVNVIEQKEDLSPDGERKSTVLQDALRASGVSPVDDDIESQISQYTVIPKTNTKWSASAAEDPSVSGASSNKTLQNISLQDTKFLTLEEAVAILGDNETRALLSNLQVETSSPSTIPTSTPTILDGQLDPTTGVYSPLGSSKSQQIQIIAQPPVVEQLPVIPPTSIVEEHLDIFSSAIASAEIQLENTEYNFEMSQPTPEEQLAADESNIIETTEVIETTDENCMEIDISPNVPLTDKQLTDILTDGDISSS